MKTARWLLVFGLVSLLILASVYGVLRQQYQEFLQQPLDIHADGQLVNVEPGMSGRAVVMSLGELGISEWSWQWRLLMRLQPAQLKAGEYRLEAGLTPVTLLEKLARGEVVQYRFTIVEGWTFAQMISALQADPMLGVELEPAQSLAELGAEIAGVENPEGLFLPETYLFARGYTAADLLQRAHQDLQLVLQDAWEMRPAGHPVETPYELLVLASIIERETAIESERGEISGVFVRRLLKGMRLQTDPTVIYGLGESFDGDIRRKDLQADTPYNTYTRHGLPPTPIALPGRASIMAAALPEEGTSLYFVANGQGGHTFSDTFEEHQKAVNIMLGRKP
jgi:UPF0755 protein